MEAHNRGGFDRNPPLTILDYVIVLSVYQTEKSCCRGKQHHTPRLADYDFTRDDILVEKSSAIAEVYAFGCCCSLDREWIV